MSIYTEYIDGLAALVQKGRPDPLKEVIYARLKGKKEPVHGLVSPPLSRDEHDENGIFYFLYEKFTAQNNEKALAEMRRVIIELLMEAFTEREELLIIDALGQMAAVFKVKEFPKLAKTLQQQLWGFMDSSLEKPVPELMSLSPGEMAYAYRAFDMWLTLTPPLPPNAKGKCYQEVIELFKKGVDIKNIYLVKELHFHFLLLIFRAILKINPSYAGKFAFFAMCRFVEDLHHQDASDKYRRGWFALCRDMGLMFRYPEEFGGEHWKELFIDGIWDSEDSEDSEKRIKEQSLPNESIKRMKLKIGGQEPPRESKSIADFNKRQAAAGKNYGTGRK